MADMVFGMEPEPTSREQLLRVFDVAALAPEPRPGAVPAVKRLVQADGVNLIALSFLAGQALTEHRAAHPITVQTLTGHARFTVGTKVAELTPGTVVHLPEMVTHRVDALQESVLLLSMHTGERHDLWEDS